jgi:hypothetical protein
MQEAQRDAAPVAAPRDFSQIALALVVGWLVPGAGHLLLGKRRRAVAFFVLIMATLAVGCSLDGELYRAVGAPIATLATLATAGVGAAYFVLLLALGYTGDMEAAGYDYGKAFILTAGLMNILLLLDIWDIGRGEKE